MLLSLLATGCNAHGQLGHGDHLSISTFARVSGITNIVAVQAGDEHTVRE